MFKGFMLVYGFVAFVLFETLSWTKWTPFYYRFGLPLYRLCYQLEDTLPDIQVMMATIDEQLVRSWWHPSIEFKAQGSHELFFRRRYSGFLRGYGSSLRESRNYFYGCIAVNHEKQEIIVTGYFSWIFTILPFLVFYIGFFEPIFFLLSGWAFIIFFVDTFSRSSQYRWVGQATAKSFPPLPNPTDLTSFERVLVTILSILILILCSLLALFFLFLF